MKAVRGGGLEMGQFVCELPGVSPGRPRAMHTRGGDAGSVHAGAAAFSRVS